jgi:hypothetical protein
VATVAICSQIEAEIGNELRVNGFDGDIAYPVLPSQVLFEVAQCRGILLAGTLGCFLTDQPAHPSEMIFPDGHDCPHGRVVDTQNGISEHFRRDLIVELNQFVVLLANLVPDSFAWSFLPATRPFPESQSPGLTDCFRFMTILRPLTLILSNSGASPLF